MRNGTQQRRESNVEHGNLFMESQRGKLVPALCLLVGLGWGLSASAAPVEQPNAFQKAKPSKMEGYDVTAENVNIAPTGATRTETVEVAGHPRMTKGHPNTYWDQEDIEHYKEMLKTSKEMQKLLGDLKGAMDKRVAEPIKIPPPQKGADGKWLFPGEYFPAAPKTGAGDEEPTAEKFGANFRHDAKDFSDLGTLYALTGEEKYAEYAKKLLLAYAVASKWGINPNYNMRGEKAMTGSLLGEAHAMMCWGNGYDLIYNLPSWTKEERAQVHDEFFYPIALSSLYPGTLDRPGAPCFASQRTNRGLFGAVSVLVAGYVTDDQELINAALYGTHPTIKVADPEKAGRFPPEKPWVAGTAKDPASGLLTCYFATECIPGGMWIEPSVGYSFYTLHSMVGAAEILWHHDIDVYRHNNAIFKNMFDFPILLSYPDLSEPAIGGSHRDLLSKFDASTLYQYAYRRYQDPRYLPIINDAKGSKAYLGLSAIARAPSTLQFDIDRKEVAGVGSRPSVNWPLVGQSVLRTPSSDGKGLEQNLTMLSGPSESKAYPDKLHIDLFALGDVLMPSPGTHRPYTQPILAKWNNTTLAENTLTVDEKSQNSYYNKSVSAPHATQLVFAPASTVGLQRAWTNSVYPGVTMDRAVFMTTDYFADIFGAFSKVPRKYDLAWHIRGEVGSSLELNAMAFPEPVANGYNTLTNVRQAGVDGKPWSLSFTREGHVARLHAAAAPATQLIVGDGGIFFDNVARGRSREEPTAPTVLERRDQTSCAVYGNALDYSGRKDGFVKGVEQEGGLDAGYALLKVQTVRGTDLCFAAYRAGSYKAGGLETDCLQAFVQRDGAAVQAMVLGGGKQLQTTGGSLERSQPGLAFVERLANGNFIVGNPSPTDGTVTVKLEALAGMKAFQLEGSGHPGESAGEAKDDGSFSVVLKAGSRVELRVKR